MPIEYLDEPKKSRIEYLDEKPSKDEGPSSQGVMAGESLDKELHEALPLHGYKEQFKEGMKSGEDLYSDAVVGKNMGWLMDKMLPLGRENTGKLVGAILGGARSAGTLLNPVGAVVGAIPKYAQATGSALAGDLTNAGRDITGSNPVKSGAEVGSLDTGNQVIDTAANTLGNIHNEVAKNPPILAAGIAPESFGKVGEFVKSKISNEPSAVTSGALKLSEAVKNLKPSRAETISEAGKQYREILAPSKGEINKVEVKAGKNLDDSYKLAAEEGLIIEKSADNKLDTMAAIEQINGKIDPVEAKLSEALAEKPAKQFNVKELAEEAKKRAREVITNDADYEAALSSIDKEADAIIKNRGENISGSELNRVKKGMWSKGYDQMAPNSQKIARVIGGVAKDAIEEAYKGDSDIQGLNSKIGEYVTLKKLLENANGRVIARGKLGKYAAQGIGAIAARALQVPVIGELGGAWVGGKVNDFLTDPARLTSKIAKKVSKLPKPTTDDILQKSADNLRPKSWNPKQGKPVDVETQKLINDLILKRRLEELQSQAD